MRNNDKVASDVLPLVLYSTGCPRCVVLKKKMEQAGMKFEVEQDVEKMTALGIKSVPMLKVGDEMLDFNKAIQMTNAAIAPLNQ